MGRRGGIGRHGRSTLVLASVMLCLSTGCDSASFVPPRPTELAGGGASGASAVAGGSAATGGVPASARAIELISAPYDPEDAENLKTRARAMAGLERSRIHIVVTGEKGAEESQAALLRKAAARNPLALIVEPVDPTDADFARAVKEASEQGHLVVLMGSELQARTSAPESAAEGAGAKSSGSAAGRIISVVCDPFPASAKQLAEAAVRNAANIGLPAEGGAVLAKSKVSDARAKERAEALKAALGSAGVSNIKEIELSGEFKDVKNQVAETMKANPKIGMVLANDQSALTAAFQAMNDVGESRHYVVSGYTTDESSATMARDGEFAAAAVYAPERILHKSIATAAAVARGDKIPDRVVVMVPVNVSPRTSGAPRLFRAPGTPRSADEFMNLTPDKKFAPEKE